MLCFEASEAYSVQRVEYGAPTPPCGGLGLFRCHIADSFDVSWTAANIHLVKPEMSSLDQKLMLGTLGAGVYG